MSPDVPEVGPADESDELTTQRTWAYVPAPTGADEVATTDPSPPEADKVPLWVRVRDAKATAVANEQARRLARRTRDISKAVARDERTADVVKAGLAIGVAALVARQRGDLNPWATAIKDRTSGAGQPPPPGATGSQSAHTPPGAQASPGAGQGSDSRRPWHELYDPAVTAQIAQPAAATPPPPAAAPVPPPAPAPSASRVSDALRQAHQDQMAVIRNLRA